MLRCAIVEDSPRELEHLKECLARYSAERDIPLCRVAGKAFFQMFQLSGAVLHDRTAQHPVLPFTKTFRNQYSALCENWQQLPLHTINIHQPSW